MTTLSEKLKILFDCQKKKKKATEKISKQNDASKTNHQPEVINEKNSYGSA